MSGKIIGILAVCWLATLIALGITIFIAMTRGDKIKAQDQRICALETAVSEFQKANELFAEAEKQAKEFEKELTNDTTDNLDVIPADYIVKQLRAD